MNEVTREEFDALRRQVAENTERMHRGDTTLALLDQRLGQIDDKLTELTTGVKALQDKPAKRWDAIISQVVNWAVMLLLGYIAIKVGL